MSLSPRSEDDPVKRREFITGLASINLVPSHAAENPYQDVDFVRGLTDRFADSLEISGGASLAETAVRHARCAQRAAQSGGKELKAAASDLIRKTSLAFYDSRNYKAAQQAGIIGLGLALKSGNINGAAHSYENLTVFTGSEDNPNADLALAATYARHGLNLPEIHDSHRVRLLVRRGAVISRSKANHRLARSLFDDALETGGISKVDHAVVQGNVGIGLMRLGVHEKALGFLDRSVTLFDGQPKNQSLYLANQVITAVDANRVDIAADLISSLSRHAALVDSVRLTRRVKEILEKTQNLNAVPEMRTARENLLSIFP